MLAMSCKKILHRLDHRRVPTSKLFFEAAELDAVPTSSSSA